MTAGWFRHTRVSWLLVSGLVVIAHSHLEAATSPSPPSLSPAQQAAIARAFAPTLVFHQLERYFPISPMHRLGIDTLATTEQEGENEQAALQAEPEAWPTRVTGYRALSLTERLQRAAIGYRVFSRVTQGQTEIVVEYWAYYVYNEFTIRGTWLPYRVPDNHPHDLERLYLILTIDEVHFQGGGTDEAWARRAFRIRSVVANAHDGSIPPNRYDTSDAVLAPPLTILVERGSHAMAPDIDQDGRFTPGVDSTAPGKLEWGIRDTGATGSRYRATFMDERDASAIRLSGPTEDGPRYDLYRTDQVQSWFQGLELSPRDRQQVLGRSSWWVRTFGDVRLETLLVPSDPPDGSVLNAMERRRIRGQAGAILGLTAAGRSPALIVGQRYFWNVGAHRAPDIAAEGVVLFAGGRRPLMEGTLWGSYTVDAITNVVVGGGWFSDRHAPDIAAGTDLRVGRFTVRPIWRMRARIFNARVTTTF